MHGSSLGFMGRGSGCRFRGGVVLNFAHVTRNHATGWLLHLDVEASVHTATIDLFLMLI